MMKGGPMTSGFTIIETMIVLAVTGFILLGAIIAMQGKTNEAEFIQVANNLQSQLQRTVSNVINGYSPLFASNEASSKSTYNFSCTAISGGPTGGTLSFSGSPSTSTQGANQGCTFLGYALQFSNSFTSGENLYTQYTIAGVQYCAGDVLISGSNKCLNAVSVPITLSEENPTALYPASVDNATQTLPTNLIQHNSIQFGVYAKSMYFNDNTSNSIGGVAMLLSPSTSSQQVNLYAIANSDLSMDAPNMANFIDQGLQNSSTTPVDNVEICLASGTTNQSGLITIGGASGQQTTVTLNIYSNNSCQ